MEKIKSEWVSNKNPLTHSETWKFEEVGLKIVVFYLFYSLLMTRNDFMEGYQMEQKKKKV